MATYSFSEEAIQHAIDAANKTHEDTRLKAMSPNIDTSKANCMLVAAECVSVTVENHSICINLPLGFGKHCFSIPLNIPNGTAGQACLHICTTFGIPTGIKVTVSLAGITVVSQSFGKC